MHEDGSPFAFLPPAPVPLFCKNSTPMKRVVMQSQPISPKSASKSKAASRPAAPRASTRIRTAVRKVAARKTSERTSPASAQKSLQVTLIHVSFFFFLSTWPCSPTTVLNRPLATTTPARALITTKGTWAQPTLTRTCRASRMLHHRLPEKG
jgi:hypothetical protein